MTRKPDAIIKGYYGEEGYSDINSATLMNSEKVNSEKLYDLQGRQILNPRKGTYIKNGRKYII